MVALFKKLLGTNSPEDDHVAEVQEREKITKQEVMETFDCQRFQGPQAGRSTQA